MPYADPAKKQARDRERYKRNRLEVIARSRRWRKENPLRYAYLMQRHTSKQRGVGFGLTFEQFMKFWGDDFRYRGKLPNDLCMGRYEDRGDYVRGNVYIATQSENRAGPRPYPHLTF